MNSYALRVSAAMTLALALTAVSQTPAFADGFDDHTAFWLRRGIAGTKPVESMSMRQGLALKRIGRGIDAPCLVIRPWSPGDFEKVATAGGFRSC